MNYSQQNYVVKTTKILANANRVRILNLIATNAEPVSVSKIAQNLDMEINLVSNQLVKMRENGLLRAKQSGVNMFYEIKDERIVEILNLLKKLA